MAVDDEADAAHGEGTAQDLGGVKHNEPVRADRQDLVRADRDVLARAEEHSSTDHREGQAGDQE